MPPSLPVHNLHHRIILSSTELSDTDLLPPELRSVVAHPEHLETLQRWIADGGIALQTLKKTPEPLARAIERISRLTQERTLTPWLSRLLEKGDMPIFTARELRAAEEEGAALYADAQFILEHRGIGKRVAWVREKEGETEQATSLEEINALLSSQAIQELLYRVRQDVVPQESIKNRLTQAILIVAPLAHVLERWAQASGPVFAVVAEPLWTEGREWYALHRAGFTARQLVRRAYPFLLTIGVAGLIAYLAGRLAISGRFALAGTGFGVAVMILPLQRALAALSRTHAAFLALQVSGKVRAHERRTGLILREHLLQPRYLSVYVGMIVAPALSAALFMILPESARNGWVLAGLSTTSVWGRNLLIFCQDTVRRGAWSEFRRWFKHKRRALDEAKEMG